MCGACGAESARTGRLHWSSPFLASPPARSAAARTMTAWARLAGWTGSVTGVASGYQVATASGRRRLAGDLGTVVEHLAKGGVARDRLSEKATAAVITEGRVTWPGPRPRSGGTQQQADAAHHPIWLASVDEMRPQPSARAGGDVVLLPADPRRAFRVPALLAWLAVVEGTGVLDGLGARLGLGAGRTLSVVVRDGRVVGCAPALATYRDARVAADMLVAPAGRPPAGLVALLR